MGEGDVEEKGDGVGGDWREETGLGRGSTYPAPTIITS
jgi:hypothetical protein